MEHHRVKLMHQLKIKHRNNENTYSNSHAVLWRKDTILSYINRTITGDYEDKIIYCYPPVRNISIQMVWTQTMQHNDCLNPTDNVDADGLLMQGCKISLVVLENVISFKKLIL